VPHATGPSLPPATGRVAAGSLVQVTISVTDLGESASFYQTAFEAACREDLSSFQLGVWPNEEFLLADCHPRGGRAHGAHRGPAGDRGLSWSWMTSTMCIGVLWRLERFRCIRR
jgi:hypothetical protein